MGHGPGAGYLLIEGVKGWVSELTFSQRGVREQVGAGRRPGLWPEQLKGWRGQ